MFLLVALVVGITIGVLGSGGAILAFPAFMMLWDIEPKVAIVSSLILVSSVSAVVSVKHYRNSAFCHKSILAFAPTSIIFSYLGAYIGSKIPSDIQVLVFIVVLLLAALKLIFGTTTKDEKACIPNRTVLLLAGSGVGFLTGFIGVGGGFLIVPSLIIIAGLTMHKAVASSAVLVLLQSLTALISYWFSTPLIFETVLWQPLLIITLISSIFAVLASYISKAIPQNVITKLFSFLLLIAASYLMISELTIAFTSK